MLTLLHRVSAESLTSVQIASILCQSFRRLCHLPRPWEDRMFPNPFNALNSIRLTNTASKKECGVSSSIGSEGHGPQADFWPGVIRVEFLHSRGRFKRGVGCMLDVEDGISAYHKRMIGRVSL